MQAIHAPVIPGESPTCFCPTWYTQICVIVIRALERSSSSCVSRCLVLPQETSKIAQDTYRMRVSSSEVLYPAICQIYPSLPIRAATIKSNLIIEASSSFCRFKQSSVRIKTTSLAIHEKMCPEVLDDIDEIIVVLWFAISNWFVLTVHVVVNVWCKLL